MRESALARLKRLPERERLLAWDDNLARAIDGAADQQTFLVLLSIMLAGFPRANAPNAETYGAAAPWQIIAPPRTPASTKKTVRLYSGVLLAKSLFLHDVMIKKRPPEGAHALTVPDIIRFHNREAYRQ